MSTTTKIKEYIVSEYNVINQFAFSGAIPVTAGTAVTFVSSSGFAVDANDLNQTSWPGVSTYQNTLSPRWTTQSLVRCAGSGDPILGILRYDVREVDENNLPLKFYPQKAAENNWIISGQSVPIIVKGFVFISGANIGGTIAAGNIAYVSGAAGSEAGEIFAGTNASTAKLGRFWGAYATSTNVVSGAVNKFALLQIEPTV
jgi:hypothetical protein